MKYKRIKDLREDKDWTQQFVADKFFISRSTYSAYENGANATPIEILIKIALLYNVSVDYILELTDDPTPPKRKIKWFIYLSWGGEILKKNLLGLREEKNLTQEKLAKILNCSQRIYSNYERGEVNIPNEILIKLSLYFNVSTDYLLDLTDDPTPPKRKIKWFIYPNWGD